MTERLEEMREGLARLAAMRDEVDRLVAAELSEESFFTIKWAMISNLVDLGLRTRSQREAGNILELLTEEVPGAITYVEKEAARHPDADVGPIADRIGDMLALAHETLGGEVYEDIAMNLRSKP